MSAGAAIDTGPVLRGALTSGKVVVAEILKPRGIRGELLARSQTDIPGRLKTLRHVQAHLRSGEDLTVELERAWQHNDDWVLKFAGVDSIEHADRFRGSELWVPMAERAELPEGEFFESDLVGLSVLDAVTAKELGVVEDVQQYGGPPLLSLKYQGREVLIPFVPQICNVDLPAKVIRVTLPDGLLDL
jgi:16S rRNA processing protein RimM